MSGVQQLLIGTGGTTTTTVRNLFVGVGAFTPVFFHAVTTGTPLSAFAGVVFIKEL